MICIIWFFVSQKNACAGFWKWCEKRNVDVGTWGYTWPTGLFHWEPSKQKLDQFRPTGLGCDKRTLNPSSWMREPKRQSPGCFSRSWVQTTLGYTMLYQVIPSGNLNGLLRMSHLDAFSSMIKSKPLSNADIQDLSMWNISQMIGGFLRIAWELFWESRASSIASLGLSRFLAEFG